MIYFKKGMLLLVTCTLSWSIMFSLQRTSPEKYGKLLLEEARDFFLLAMHAGNNCLQLFGYHSTSLEWLNPRKRKMLTHRLILRIYPPSNIPGCQELYKFKFKFKFKIKFFNFSVPFWIRRTCVPQALYSGLYSAT